MFEAVHAVPDGETTITRFAATAARYGYDGVVARVHSDARLDVAADATAAAAAYDVDVVPALEVVTTDPSRASGYVGGHRGDYAVLVVRGGSTAMNRFAVESDRVDVLAAPMREEGDFNHVLAKAAVEHDVHVELNLGAVLRKSGGRRVAALRGLRKLRELVEQYDVPYVLTADARTHHQLRAPRELMAVGEAVGLTAEQVRTGLDGWQAVVARNRERLSDSFIAPGIERGRYEKEPR